MGSGGIGWGFSRTCFSAVAQMAGFALIVLIEASVAQLVVTVSAENRRKGNILAFFKH